MPDSEKPPMLCVGHSPWFDSRFHGEPKRQYEYRMRACWTVCAQCQHKRSCKFTAEQLSRSERTGVWCGVDIGTNEHCRGIDWSNAPPERPQDSY